MLLIALSLVHACRRYQPILFMIMLARKSAAYHCLAIKFLVRQGGRHAELQGYAGQFVLCHVDVTSQHVQPEIMLLIPCLQTRHC